MPELHGNRDLILDQESINAPASTKEQTRAQLPLLTGLTGVAGFSSMESALGGSETGIVGLGQNWYTSNYMYWQKVRRMRRHPTIKLTRVLSAASMSLAKWSVEADDDAPKEARDIISDLLPMQTHICSTAFFGLHDWGWQPYEKVMSFDTVRGRTKLRKLKPLLQDQTVIMVIAQNGAFAGFKQHNKYLSLSNSLLLNQDVEGTYHYGESTMASIEPAYDRWIVADAANVRYDRKVAGAHWVIHYPVGVSNLNGNPIPTDNFQVAQELLRKLEASGSIAVPATVLAQTTDLNNVAGEEAWKVEILAAPSAQGDFQARLGYLDTLMVRGGEFPERAILEGQYGTKAEAGEHADFAIGRMDFRNKQIADSLNWHVSNQLLRMNCGQDAENKARLKVAPIADDARDTLKNVLTAALSSPASSTALFQSIDMQSILTQLEVPVHDADSQDNNSYLNNMLQTLQQPDENEQTEGNPNIPPDGKDK